MLILQIALGVLIGAGLVAMVTNWYIRRLTAEVMLLREWCAKLYRESRGELGGVVHEGLLVELSRDLISVRDSAMALRYLRNYVWEVVDPREKSELVTNKFRRSEVDDYGLWTRQRDHDEELYRITAAARRKSDAEPSGGADA